MIRKIIKISIVLLCMTIIFLFSSDNATESNKKSDGVIINMCKLFTGHDLNSKEKKNYIGKYVVYVRKSAHFMIYLILGISLISLIGEYRQLDIKAIIIALTIAILYAISDEIHQLFVSGRSGEILDVFIDSIGSIMGVSIYYLLSKIRRNTNEQKKAIS